MRLKMIYNAKYKLYVSKEGLLFRIKNDKLELVKTRIANGYELVGKNYRVHRIVWETFKGQINGKNHIHHIDHNGLNNRLDNLVEIEPGEHSRLHHKGISSGTGRICSDDTRKKISDKLTGKKFTEEQKLKLRNSHLGKKLSVEHKQSIGNSLKGKTYSEFGIKFKEHYGIAPADNRKLYHKENAWYLKHNRICRWEADNAES